MSLAKTRAFIVGVSGYELSADENKFLSQYAPWGVILFARNILDQAQLVKLCADIRGASGRDDMAILIDQEGGRVARIRAPLMRNYPAMRVYGELYNTDPDLGTEAVRLGGELLARDLKQFGINVNCAPCLDVSRPETADVIGDRAFSSDPTIVGILGRAFAEGLMAGGVLPVIKHLPGHGRGQCDSHIELPEVDASFQEMDKTDFIPFRALCDAPLGMTGHLLFRQIDAVRVSTCSPIIIQQIIRDAIGFEGVLMGDDVSMEALSGDIISRGQQSLEAGCDLILHCNGKMDEMLDLASITPILASEALARVQKVQKLIALPDTKADPEMAERWGELVSGVFTAA